MGGGKTQASRSSVALRLLTCLSQPPWNASIREGIADQYRIFALGRGRYQRHRTLDQFLDTLDILDGLSGQVNPAARAGCRIMPAFHFLINGLDRRLVAGVRREIVEHLAVEPVAGADFQLRKSIEHVELGERDAGPPGDGTALPPQRRIEPATAALAPCDGAEFMAALAKPLAGFVLEFGRERTRSDAGGIGLDDSEHEAACLRSKPAAARGRTRDRVRRGDKGIGAVIDIEQHALCAFEQHPRAGASDLAQALPYRLRELEHKRRDLGQFGDQLGAVDRRFAKPGAQRVMVRAKAIELRIERVEMRQVAHANGPPADLILIGGSDTATRRA